MSCNFLLSPLSWTSLADLQLARMFIWEATNALHSGRLSSLMCIAKCFVIASVESGFLFILVKPLTVVYWEVPPAGSQLFRKCLIRHHGLLWSGIALLQSEACASTVGSLSVQFRGHTSQCRSRSLSLLNCFSSNSVCITSFCSLF